MRPEGDDDEEGLEGDALVVRAREEKVGFAGGDALGDERDEGGVCDLFVVSTVGR